MKGFVVALGLVGSLCLLLSCSSESPAKSSVRTPPDLSITPMENEEAEVAALTVSRELVAPIPLYERIRRDLELIRSRYHDSVPQVAITFVCPFRPSSIGLQVREAVFFDTITGGGRIFDSLNRVYRLDTFFQVFENFYDCRFNGRLNSVRLVDKYAGIPGERIVYSTSPGPGDGPQLLILPGQEVFKYFFRDAWGDCPSGCMHSKIFYFETFRDKVKYRGFYPDNVEDPEAPPAWFDTAKMAWDANFYYGAWYADSADAR